MTTKPWRQEIEILQSYSKHKAFTYTTTSANSETAIDLGLAMEEVNKVSFVKQKNNFLDMIIWHTTRV